MRTCSKCSHLQEEINFRNSKTTKDGLSWQCKSCDKIQRRAHYLVNREKEIARASIRNADKRTIRAYENERFHSDPKVKLSVCLSGAL